MLKAVIAAAGVCVATVQAQAADLSGRQIKALLAGATVEIDTPVGSKLPVRYGRDGKLLGKAGDLAWYLGTAIDRGRWWVASGELCHKWRRWLDSQPQCMRLHKQGRVLRWRTRDGYSGTARISVPPRVRTAAVVPPARSAAAKETAPSEAPPAPAASAASPAGKRKERPSSAEPSSRAGRPPRPTAKEAATPPPAVETRPAPAKSPSRPKRAKIERAARPTFKVANVRSDDVLNVRSGPSADFDIVGELPPGSRGIAIISECRSRWCPVQHRTTRGWVHSAYLAADDPVSPLSALRGPHLSSWRESRGRGSRLRRVD